MKSFLHNPITTRHPEFLNGGGEMGLRIREFDWSTTSLGPVENWPQSLRSAISICLNSNFPIAIYWGKDLILLYNDSWSPIPGNKHPWALGLPAKKVWPDIWADIEPQFQKAFNGQPGGSKDALLPMQRHGYTEECYFDFTFTPVYGEGGKVEGVFNAVIETTYRIINERRTTFLKNLALHIATAQTSSQMFQQAIQFIKTASQDVSFALLYTYVNMEAWLAASSFTEPDKLLNKQPWPFAEITESGEAFFIKKISDYFLKVPQGFWPEEPEEGLVIPLRNSVGSICGFFICGLSARCRFDKEYDLFVRAIGNTLSTTLSTISALEEERQRTTALAEIDKAKTAFFTNISHEFRTPLTLMLGSLEQLMNKQDGDVDSFKKETLETSHRNAMRLLRLVNNLLDFSRIEAGKAWALFQLTDIVELTKDLAAGFRSVIEGAGLAFQIQAEAIIQPVYVDTEMWEKVVLNLLSNAFKYTLKGSVTLSLTNAGDKIMLTVTDTGVGIPEAELPKMFQRFHRVQNSTGRTFEGTGIGLSLVNELVKLHGGSIAVTSTEGIGSSFTVAIPTGKSHLPATQVTEQQTAFTASLFDSFIDEASLLIKNVVPDNDDQTQEADLQKPVVLVVDDNADMREYFRALLKKDYKVVTANNGADALKQMQNAMPALIVSDIMMPVMDGFKLVKAVKSAPQTQNIPLILLSARAGEESKIEGFQIGADDYLVKPFSSKELLARVAAQISIAKKRRSLLQEVYTLFDGVPFAVAVLKGESLILEYINQYNLDIWQCKKEQVLGKPLFETKPEIRAGAEPVHAEVYKTGKRFIATEIALEVMTNGRPETRYFNSVIDPMFNEQGKIIGQLATSIEVTEQVTSRKKLEGSKDQLAFAIDAAELATWDFNPLTNKFTADARYAEWFGITTQEATDNNLALRVIADEDRERVIAAYTKALQYGCGSKYDIIYTIRPKNKPERILRAKGKAWFGDDKLAYRFNGTLQDVTKEIRAKKEVEASEERFRTTFENAAVGIAHVALDGNWLFMNNRISEIFGYTKKELQGLTFQQVTHPEDLNADLEYLQQLLQGSISTYTMEKRYIRKNGSVIWANLTVSLRRGIDGAPKHFISIVEDITIRKKAETALRESETRFRNLADDSPMFVYIIDANAEATISYWNKTWLHYTGQKIDEALGRAWDGIIHPDDVPVVLDIYVPAFEKRQPYYIPAVRTKRYDGEYRWYMFKASPRYLPNGEFNGYVGVGFDVHDQKLAEEALKASEGRFRNLAETLPQLVWTTNESGEYEYASSQWLKYSGLDPLEGATWGKLVHPDDMQAMMQAWTNSLKMGETYHAEARLRSKEGEYRWHFVQGEPIYNAEGRINKWIGAFTDIHDQKTLSENLEKLVAERTKELYRSNEDLQQFAHVASHDLKEPIRKVRTFGSRLEEEFGDQLPEKGKLYLDKMQSAAERMFGLIDGVLNYSTINSLESSIQTVDLASIIQNIETDLEVVVQQKGAQISKGDMPVVKGSSVLLNQLFYNLINNSLKFSKPGVAPVVTVTSQKVKGAQVSISDSEDAHKEFVQVQVCDNGIGFSPEYEEKIFKTFTRLNSRDRYEGTGLGLALCKKIAERHQGYIYASAKEGEGACFYVLLPV